MDSGADGAGRIDVWLRPLRAALSCGGENQRFHEADRARTLMREERACERNTYDCRPFFMLACADCGSS